MGTTRQTIPQVLTVEYTVTGSLDGTTPAPPVEIDQSDPNATPFDVESQVYRPDPVENLGLIDPALALSGSIGPRCIPFVTLDTEATGDPGASLDVVAARLGPDVDEVVFQRQILDLGGVVGPVYIDEGFNVPQGSEIRLGGIAAGAEPIRVRVSILVPVNCLDLAAYRPIPANGNGGDGGPGWGLDCWWVDGANTDAGADGTMLNPFPTIQQAIDAAEAFQGTLPIGFHPGERAAYRALVIVAPGFYDEDLDILRGDTFFEFLAKGPVTLGDGEVGENFGSTTPRNVTWRNSQAQEDADSGSPNDNRRPQLIFSTFIDQSGGAESTHIMIAGGWDISGDVRLTWPVAELNSSTKELHFNNVRIRGVLDPSADKGICNIYTRGTRFSGGVLPPNTGGVPAGSTFLQKAYQTRFGDAQTTLGVFDPTLNPCTFSFYGRLVNCEIANDFTANLVAVFNGIPPEGIYDTVVGSWDFGGAITFTVTNSLLLDAASNFWFTTLGGGSAIAGGGAKTVIHSLA